MIRKREKERLFISFFLTVVSTQKNRSTDVLASIVNRLCKNALTVGFASRIGTRVASIFDGSPCFPKAAEDFAHPGTDYFGAWTFRNIAKGRVQP
jgi:hypothetical protein